jgi:hypothetical protein
MGGSVVGAYMQSMEPKPAPFYDDEHIWKRELLHRDQITYSERPLERMHTLDLISLQHRTNAVGNQTVFSHWSLFAPQSDARWPQELAKRNWQRALSNMQTDTLEGLSSLLDRKLSTRDLSSRERRREPGPGGGAGEYRAGGEHQKHGNGAGERGSGQGLEQGGSARDVVSVHRRPRSAGFS